MRTINLIFLLLIVSCQTKKISNLRPTNNNGGYTMSVAKNSSLYTQDRIVVYGYVKELGQNTPLKASQIKYGCYVINVNNDGFYRFKEKTTEEIFITSSWIGYRTVETENLKLEKGDSVKIDFFLAPDDRPLINCEGK